MIRAVVTAILDEAERRLARPWAVITFITIATGLGLLSTWPHMHEAVWQDEAVTILFHASRGVVDPFVHYLSPNNHVGFTSFLAAWMGLFQDGLDVSSLRMLPLLLFVCSIPMTYAAAWRLSGHACAALATVLFATSAVSENFATQLRGYGPSWVFISAALLCALSAHRSRIWIAGYAVASMCAVAILPTNLYMLLVIGFAAAVAVPAETPVSRKREARIALLAIPPSALLMAYAAILGELVALAQLDLSQWTPSGLLWEWLRGAMSNLAWLVPLVGACLTWSLAVVVERRPLPPPALASLGLALGFVAMVAALPNPPFPRTLAPYLPVWIIAMCAMSFCALRYIRSRSELLVGASGASILMVSMYLGPLALPCWDAPSNGQATQYDLCYQYFRDGYNPSAVLDAWAEQPEPLPIITNMEGFYALRILDPPTRVLEFRSVTHLGDLKPLFVAHDRADAAAMMAALGLDPRRYRIASDTGYFKVFAPEPLP